jgi:pre-60S factor REI1
MRSDWHRYNLKRRMAELPPTSAEDYKDKVLAAQAVTDAAAKKAGFETTCDICQKTYFSENAYRNHMGSQKHKLRVAAGSRKGSVNGSVAPSVTDSTLSGGVPTNGQTGNAEAEAEFEKVVEGIEDTSLEENGTLPKRPSRPTPSKPVGRETHPLSPTATTESQASSRPAQTDTPLSRCLFCNYDSPTWKLSISHMTKIHGLFIPEQNYLVDLEGLLGYLQAKVTQNHECICCHKLKNNTDGVQTHMRDKGHCKIAFETEEEMIEVGQYYDFSSTYSDAEGSDSDTEMEEPARERHGGAKLPGSGTTADDGWETDSSFSSLDSEELTSVPNDDHTSQYERLPLHRHHSKTDPRPHRSADGFHSHAHSHNTAVFYDEHEMHLPSGRVAGHRSLKKYYRQNLHSYPTAAERIEEQQRRIEDGEDEDMADADTTNQSRAVAKRSEAGMIGATVSQRKEVRSSEIRGRQQAQRAQNRIRARDEKQNNSQKHFRVSLIWTLFLYHMLTFLNRTLCCSDGAIVGLGSAKLHRLLFLIRLTMRACS